MKSFLCMWLDVLGENNWFGLFTCISSRNWFQGNKSYMNYDDGDMIAMAIVMIMMLRIMMIIILIITKVTIMKSVIIKMIMMFTMMITIWLNTECSNYSTYIRGGFLDSCHHFVTFFEIYSLTVQEIYYEKEI